MRTFSIADLFKELAGEQIFVIEMPKTDAYAAAEQEMDELVDKKNSKTDYTGPLPERTDFTTFSSQKAYLIKAEQHNLPEAESWLDLQPGFSSYKLAGGCNQVAEITPANGTNFHLDQLYSMVGRPVEIVYDLPGLSENTIMIINEEGWLEGEPVHNMMASLLAGRPIAGDVVICPDEMFQ